MHPAFTNKRGFEIAILTRKARTSRFLAWFRGAFSSGRYLAAVTNLLLADVFDRGNEVKPLRQARPRRGRMIVAAWLLAPLPAYAQSGPSGSLTVQMKVGDELGTLTRPTGGDPNAPQTLGAGNNCTASSNPLDFGTRTLQAGGTLPVGTIKATGSVTITCTPPSNPDDGPPGSTNPSTFSVHADRGHGTPGGFLLMTLNNTNSPLGIFYSVSTKFNILSNITFDSPGSQDTVKGNVLVDGSGSSDDTGFIIFATILGSNFPGGSIPAGRYQDTLRFTLTF